MHDGSKIKSTQLQPNQSTTYLGITSQVDGDQSAQTEVIKKKANNISRKSKCCHMPHYHAHVRKRIILPDDLSIGLIKKINN